MKKKLPDVLTTDEIDILLNQPNDGDCKGIRDRAMLEVLYATGIRVSELIRLKKLDININLGYIKCQDNKKERIIPIGQVAKIALKRYMEEVRPVMIKDPQEVVLFVSCLGHSMSRQGFWKIVKSYAGKAGINKKDYASYLATFICNPFSRKWCRPTLCSRDVRAFRYIYYSDLCSDVQ